MVGGSPPWQVPFLFSLEFVFCITSVAYVFGAVSGFNALHFRAGMRPKQGLACNFAPQYHLIGDKVTAKCFNCQTFCKISFLEKNESKKRVKPYKTSNGKVR